MTTRSFITIAASAIILSGVSLRAAAQNGFNGTITFETRSDNGRTGTLIETSSGNKVRIESLDSTHGPPRGAVVINGDTRTFTTIMTAQQKYMVVTEAQIKAMAGAMGQRNPTPPTPSQLSIVNTGRTETVAGVSCQVYHVTGGASTQSRDSDVCIADGVGFLSGLADMMTSMGSMGGATNGQAMAQLGDFLKGGKGVLKVTEQKGGQSVVSLVAVKIDRTPPPASAFEPPPGYTQMQMPAMPGMAGTPGGMPGVPPGAKPPGSP